jgi:predicted porin
MPKSYGQRSDAALWTSLELEKLLVPKVLIHYKQSVRFGQNFSQLIYSFSDLGATYKFNKSIKTSLDYRFINKQQRSQEQSFRHRVYWTLTLKKKVKPFILSYRHRIQYQLEDILTSENGYIPDVYSRSKIAVKYPINRFTPFVAAELYTKIINWDQLLPNRYRLSGGCGYSFNKTNELILYYLFDKRFNQNDPLTNYVIGITYCYTFY